MSKVSVVGSLNMDLVLDVSKMPKVGETITGTDLIYLVGGKGANQAVCCSRLSDDVLLIGMVGDDAFGEKILNKMRAEGIDTNHVKINENSSSGVAVITKAPEDNQIIVIPGSNSLFTSSYIEEKENLIAQSDILISQLEIPIETVAAAMRLAKDNGIPTILNPAPFRLLSEEFLMNVDYITPNETEFLEMANLKNKDISMEKAMLFWQKEHRTRLIVTLGADGCAYVENGMVKKVPANKAMVVDTTGAGDTFNGALAHCLAQKEELGAALAFAVKAGSLSVGKLGAQTGMPMLEEVLQAS
ncbi:ribokinase [Enterocloster citroniae]|uniref:ribokinase n=2 Tax=Bacteria TaxID=2 RepID=UPI001D07FB13|nr:ribokinase [Enterocloster citroniae]MCB7068066.1 ribokinase [Enterocloster citroniae]